MSEKIAVIIPAYNEECAIEAVIASVNALNIATAARRYIPLVINDCSKDHTGKLIDKADCIPVHLAVNLGIGGAVQTGFLYALENDFDYAIQIDGDGQHPPEYIPRMLEELKAKNFDVIIGSRFLTNEGFQSTLARRMGINYFHHLNKWLVGVAIKDSTSGMRMLNRRALKIVSEYYPDEYPEPEAIVLYAVNKLNIGEFPVQMNERQGGVSSINTAGSVYYMFKVTLAIFFTWARLRKIVKVK